MNTSYIVIFESTNKAAAIRDGIKKLSGWGKITENSFVVLTTKSAVEIRDSLLPLKDPGDRVFVVKSGVESAWSNTAASNEWLKKNI